MICIRHQYKWCWKHILINFFIMNVQFVCIFNIHKLFLYNIDSKEKIVVIIKKIKPLIKNIDIKLILNILIQLVRFIRF